MTMTLAQALASNAPRLGIFLRLHIDPIARLWLGVGHARVGIDATDGTGAIYKGLGEILDLPAFTQLINGSADKVEFSLNGVSQDIVQMASSEADDVKGVALLVGLGCFDHDWQLIASPTWLRRFTCDYISVQQTQDLGSTVRTVTLHARTFLTGRRRPTLSYWTDYEQTLAHPGDRICQRTVLYTGETQKKWPRFF